ncbi:MAG: SatD family protein [Candidatus Thermoplasmatota archaeon]|nr:SatD family protein [Candidatus Thermoplasmatota archaeon]
MEREIYLLSGDVVSSRRMEEREEAQKKLFAACNEINDRYSDDICAEFKILKGTDEVGGALNSIKNVYRILSIFSQSIHPNKMRFVLAFGIVDVASSPRDIAKMDGPVFHLAAEQMFELKQTKLLFAMRTGDNLMDKCFEGEINLLFLIKNTWSPKQHKIVKEYERTENQYETAESIGVSQQHISKTLNRVMWKDIKHIESQLDDALRGYSNLRS